MSTIETGTTFSRIVKTRDNGEQKRTYVVKADNGDLLKMYCVETKKTGDFQRDTFLAAATKIDTPPADEKPADKPADSNADKPADSNADKPADSNADKPAEIKADSTRAAVADGKQYYLIAGKLIVAPATDETPAGATMPAVTDLLAAVKVRAPRKPSAASAARTAAAAVRDSVLEMFENAAPDYGLRAERNDNVPHVIKIYTDKAYTLYMRGGLKTVQFLTRESTVPAGEKHALIKYGLPASVVVEYDKLYTPATEDTPAALTERAAAFLAAVVEK